MSHTYYAWSRSPRTGPNRVAHAAEACTLPFKGPAESVPIDRFAGTMMASRSSSPASLTASAFRACERSSPNSWHSAPGGSCSTWPTWCSSTAPASPPSPGPGGRYRQATPSSCAPSSPGPPALEDHPHGPAVPDPRRLTVRARPRKMPARSSTKGRKPRMP
jgi:hypothetical protein